MQFFGVPTTEPVRLISRFTNGTVGSQYSPMPRTMRGGSRSRTVAVPIIAASSATWPAWLEISSTRPSGRFSMPYVSTRK